MGVPMAIDWDEVSKALHNGGTGQSREALETLTSMECLCETDDDRAAILLGKSMCCAHLGDLEQASDYVNRAKQLALRPEPMLQVGLTEAAIFALKGEYQVACKYYENIATNYPEILWSDTDSAREHAERFAYVLVHVGRYEEAVHVFQKLLRSDGDQDE